MKRFLRLQSQTAGPVWGLLFGLFNTAVGMCGSTEVNDDLGLRRCLTDSAAIIGVVFR